MKYAAITIFAAAVIGLIGTAAGAASIRTTAPKTLRVVMRDPGCHWFAVGHRFTTRDTVAGRVRLLNQDIATLKATSAGGVKRIPVGRSVVLGRGHYMITMVGQAPDDNHLRLVVR